LPSFLALWFLFLKRFYSQRAGTADDATGLPAQSSPSIQDDSFLIEEAYSQEDGVIRHTNSFLLLTQSPDWVFTETDEWPVRSLKHHLSMTLMAVPTQAAFQARVRAGEDTALNCRYQLLGSGEARVAVASTVSLLLPTGESTVGGARADSVFKPTRR